MSKPRDVLWGVQYGVIPNGRMWIRGSIGSGWMSGSMQSDDGRISISIDGGSGLALGSAAGVSVWTRQFDDRRLSLDAEVHYLHVNANGLTATLPSIRLGVRWTP